MRETYELKSGDLRYFCDPKIFTFKSTADIDPLDEVIGQKRAVQAIEFGLNMKNPEYNIFVTGIEGTGKSNAPRLLYGEQFSGSLSSETPGGSSR